MPLTREREGGRFWLPGEEGPDRAIEGSVNIVTAGFFKTLGLPFLAGRNFDASDRDGSPAVAIVNETLARRAWPGRARSANGSWSAAAATPWSSSASSATAKYRTIGEGPSPFFYVSAAQRYERVMWILMRPTGPSAVPSVRAVVRQMDPNLPVVQAEPSGLTAFTLFPQRLVMWLTVIVRGIRRVPRDARASTGGGVPGEPPHA